MFNNSIDNVTILASSRDEADEMRSTAESRNVTVRGTAVWDGPCPDGSFTWVAPFVRMSTPEYFILRKAWEMDLYDAVMLIDELCGLYATRLTRPDLAEGELEVLDEPRTTTNRVRRYLEQVADTEQGQKALHALSFAQDEIGGPIAAKIVTRRRVEKMTTAQ